eukprot:scaffold59884_cov22-Tisochrysis_lutea.AAC.2
MAMLPFMRSFQKAVPLALLVAIQCMMMGDSSARGTLPCSTHYKAYMPSFGKQCKGHTHAQHGRCSCAAGLYMAASWRMPASGTSGALNLPNMADAVAQ